MRSIRAVKTSSASSRASWAPRQWWMPPPNDIGRMFWRPTSSRSGSAYCAGSRLAAPSSMITLSLPASVTPPTSTSVLVTRPVICTDES